MSKDRVFRKQCSNLSQFYVLALVACGSTSPPVSETPSDPMSVSGCVRATAEEMDSALLGRFVEVYGAAGTDEDVDRAISNIQEENGLNEEQFWAEVERQGHERSTYRADVARLIGEMRLENKYSLSADTLEGARARYAAVPTTQFLGECVEVWPRVRLRELPMVGNALVTSAEIHATMDPAALDAPTDVLPFGPLNDEALVFAVRRIYSDRGRLKTTITFRYRDGEEVPTMVISEGPEYQVGAVRFSIDEALNEITDRVRSSCPAIVGEVAAFGEIRGWRDSIPQIAETIGMQVETELRSSTDDEQHTVELELVVRRVDDTPNPVAAD